MAVKETIQLGNPLLKAKNKVIENFVDPKVQQVIVDLVDTMHQVGLIGMAAPQIGENYMIFVTEPRATGNRSAENTDELRIYINPRLIEESIEETVIYEGCGSFKKTEQFGPVSRPKVVTVEAFDAHGKKFQLKCDGILARVIQHEYDHLQGITFNERVKSPTDMVTIKHYREKIKPSALQTSNSKITLLNFQQVG
jgi:peptide deformylase